MWCDLKIHILSYWYHVKVWSILFLELFTWISSDTGIKSYWCSKAVKNKEKHRNYDVNFLYFAVSLFATCEGFSQITSQIHPGYSLWTQEWCDLGLVVIGALMGIWFAKGANFLLVFENVELVRQFWTILVQEEINIVVIAETLFVDLSVHFKLLWVTI